MLVGVGKGVLLERCPQFRGVLIEGFRCITSDTHEQVDAIIHTQNRRTCTQLVLL